MAQMVEQPTERGVWMSEPMQDGRVYLWVIPSRGAPLIEGFVRPEIVDYDLSMHYWQILNAHDSVVKITA